MVSGIATFGLVVALVPALGAHHAIEASQWLRVDAISVVFLLATAFVYAAAGIFAVGYLSMSAEEGTIAAHTRRFHAGLNLFAWSMLCVPLVNDLALLWIAIEVTTVVSVLLVAVADTEGATEAAWKYVVLASLGLGIALFATVLMYFAGTKVFGSAYEPHLDRLLASAAGFPQVVVKLSFVLAVLGFGTKMGLVPVHTWLPDAHSEAPTPVSAMLSGSLLATSFYAILRYFQITQRAVGPTFPRNTLLVFGVASLMLAALYVLDQRNLKRLLAYSSVEHMGILAIGVSFGAPLAFVGIFLHVLAHAAAKGTAFFGAGSLLRKFHTQDMRRLSGGADVLPWSGPMFLLGVLALCGMPPFGLFRSEFQIVAGGMSGGRHVLAALLVGLVTIAFFGLTLYGTRIVLSPAPEGAVRGESSAWMVAAMVVGLVALVVLGIHPPSQLRDLLTHAASQLSGAR